MQSDFINGAVTQAIQCGELVKKRNARQPGRDLKASQSTTDTLFGAQRQIVSTRKTVSGIDRAWMQRYFMGIRNSREKERWLLK
jgi:hypothetical protein